MNIPNFHFTLFILKFCGKIVTLIKNHIGQVVSWSSSSNAFASGAEDLRFKSQAGQIEHRLSTARHRCSISSKEAWLPVDAMTRKLTLCNSLHASAYYSEYCIIKDLTELKVKTKNQ